MRREERITFQEKTQTGTNDFNEPIYSWGNISTTPTVWAEANPRTANEDFQQVQDQAFQRYQFKILWRDDLDVQMRIQWNGKNWNIRSITPIHSEPRNKELEIIAEWKANTEG